MNKPRSRPESLLDDRAGRRLDIATRAARIAVWEWEFGSDQLHYSSVFYEMLGLDPVSFGGSLDEFVARVAPEHHQRVQDAVAAHLEHQVPYNLRFDMFHQSGRRVTVEAQGEAEFSPSGEPLRMTGTVRDVSAETRLADRLLEAERVAKIGHWELDVASQRIIWSPETYRIHGLDPDTYEPNLELGLSIYHPDDRSAVQHAYEGLFQGKPMDIDARMILEDGTTRYVHIQGSTDFRADGQPQRLFGVLHDRTDFVDKERQLEHAQRLQAFGQLAGGVAHDFNNLLAVILGNLEFIREEAASKLSKADLDFVDEAIAATLRGSELTQGLLSFSRTAHLLPKSTAPDALVERVVGLLRRTLPASLEVAFEPGAPDWSLHVDQTALEACLLNLAINARDAMSGCGHLTVKTRQVNLQADEIEKMSLGLEPGSFVEVSVTDNGPGIEPDALGRAFEPFFTTKPVGAGSGLGLSRVKGFAEQSGGDASIATRMGRGTTVSIFLPATAETQATAGPTKAPSQSAETQDARVLLVEDLEAVRKLLTVQLTRMGLSVTVAGTGDHAAGILEEEEPFDLVITDMVMPGPLQGKDVAAVARRRSPKTPVVFITGYALGPPSDTDPEMGANDLYLMKPVASEQLRAAVSHALLGKEERDTSPH